MKRTFIVTCILTTMFIGCTKQEVSPSEVTVSLDYSFVESGSMTRAGDAVYSDFYEMYVKTKVLTPRTYSLTFTNKETGAVAKIEGEWTKNHSLKLLTGEYDVEGASYPPSSYSKACIDSIYLRFNETIKITNETSAINLTAQYDSYLLMFDESDKTSVSYSYSSLSNTGRAVDLKVLNELYYAFLNKKYGDSSNKLYIYREVGMSTIDMTKVPFEKGHYYYFNDLSNSFDIPPMTSGN